MTDKKFGIIGKPLSHSLSPILHNFWYKKYKISANYSLIEIELKEIEQIIKKIRSRELQGINVTVPYKQAVIPFLDLLAGDAKETQSVNTISLNDEGKIVGNNTDVYLILGAGGVTPSIIYALERKKVKKVFISNRTLKKAEEIKQKFRSIEIIEWKDIENETGNMDIIINSTSLGLKGGANFEQGFNRIKPSLIYYDVIYNPNETTMIKMFKKKGIKTFNGLEMFIYQGQKSFLLWNEIKPESNEKLIKTIVAKLK